LKKLLLFLVFVATSAVSAAEEYATLSVVVTDESGNPVKWARVTVEGTDVHLITLEDGYTSLAQLPPGRYTLICSGPGFVDYTVEDVLLVAGIRSTVKLILKRPPEDQVLIIRKPNIYLYPEEMTEVTVTLNFPVGGGVTVSDPPYGDGWNVTVEPDGRMSDSRGYLVAEVGGEEVIFDAPRYPYLFYEADVPVEWQRERGWIVEQDNLFGFFTENLSAYGFSDTEIQDFLDYWEPRLVATQYAVFPQHTADIKPLICLDVNPEPQSVLRLYYYLVADPLLGGLLGEPEIPDFEREGFTVVEWGVCIDGELR
jgi:hypothetical protein